MFFSVLLAWMTLRLMIKDFFQLIAHIMILTTIIDFEKRVKLTSGMTKQTLKK
jgi:hypothetical protein